MENATKEEKISLREEANDARSRVGTEGGEEGKNIGRSGINRFRTGGEVS